MNEICPYRVPSYDYQILDVDKYVTNEGLTQKFNEAFDAARELLI